MSGTVVVDPVRPTDPVARHAWLDEAGNLVVPAAALPPDLRLPAIVTVGQRPSRSDAFRLTLRATADVAFATLLLAGLLAVVASHGRQLTRTGFAGATPLWNWLHLFVQPIALVFRQHLPGLARSDDRAVPPARRLEGRPHAARQASRQAGLIHADWSGAACLTRPLRRLRDSFAVFTRG